MANNNVQDFGNAVKTVNEILAEHATYLEKSAKSLNKYINALRGVPSDYLNFQRDVNEQLKRQEEQIKRLNDVIRNLNQTRSTQSQRTQEEITNSRILAQNANRQVLATSQLAGAYRNLSAQVAISSERLRNIIARGRTATQTQSEFNRELRQAQREFEGLQQRVLRADRAVGAWGRTGERSLGFLSNLMGAFGIAGGVAIFATMTNSMYEQTKEIQSLDMALKQVTETQSNFYNQQVFLSDIAEKYGTDINDLTRQYTQFYVSAKDKLGNGEIQQIFESITKAGSSMGLSMETQQRAFLALNQMMSKGTVSAEELRGQLGEALPGAFGIMAKAMGVTEQKLGKMMKDGEVLASEVLPKFARQLEITYGIENINRVENMATAQNRLSTAWANFVRSVNSNGNALGELFTWILKEATDTLKTWEKILESTGRSREKDLNSTRKGYENLAKSNLKNISDEVQKRKYATDQIIQLEKDKQTAINNANKLQAENQKIRVKETKRGAFGDYLTTKGSDLILENQKQIAKYNNEIMKSTGLIDGYSTALIKHAPIVKDNTEDKKKNTKATKDNNKEKEKEKDLVVGSIDWLENQISLIKQQQEGFSTNNEIYKDYQNQIDGYVKSLEEIIGKQKEVKEVIDSIDLTDEEAYPDWAKWKKLKEATDEYIKTISSDAFNKAFENIGLSSAKMFFDFDQNGQSTFDKLIEGADSFKEKFAITFQAIGDVAQQVFSKIFEMDNLRFENAKNNLDKEKEYSLAFAGDNASARVEIERQYQERLKKIKQNEFKTKQKQALFNIAIDTAQGIMGALASTPPNVPLSIVIGAIGLAQAGVVASQQMPEFYKGTDNAPEGWALTQERGAEIITDKSGKVKSLGNEKGAQYTYLNKGDKVFTASETDDILNKNIDNLLNNTGVALMPRININNGVSDEQIDRIVNSIHNKESVNINVDENGFKVLVKNGHTTKEKENKRVNFVANVI